MRFRQVDLLGYHTGALVATELAIARPQQVRRVVLAGVAALTEAEREAFRKAPWPVPPAEDGGHLAVEWARTMKWRGPGVTLDMAARSFAEKLRSGPNGAWAATAVMHYPTLDRLAQVTQPTLVLRPKDDLWEATQRARQALPRARFVDLPNHGFELLEVAPDAVAKEVRPFLAG
jgi:pimeloyl-ACP methyl ester carboxylesterase